MSTLSLSAEGAQASTRLYRAVWRWHFYAGLFVVPFLLMLAVTGTFMMLYSQFSNELGWVPNVAVVGEAKAPSAQAKAALVAVPGGKLATYIAPEAANRPAFIELSKDGTYFAVAVDPYSGTVLEAHDESTTYRALAERIHGSLLLGDWGDWLIEVAASLSVIMVVTGLFMWWPRGEGFLSAFVPRLAKDGRMFWKEVHKTAGVWISLFLVLFMLSGLAWAGVWGGKFVQPWSSFPANKWDNVPLSDLTHASLNHDILHEVPWPLEQTQLPASGSQAGKVAVQGDVTLDGVVLWAQANGFTGQYKVSIPGDEKAVFTVANDGRNEDSANPSSDRFVHIDQYTGNVLADVGYADYKPVGKLMAWGIGLHKGMAGIWNLIFNLVYMALVVLVCISGIAMWWKRKPVGQLGSPKYPREYRLSLPVGVLGAALAIAFPLGGLAIVVFAIIDFLLPKRLKEAGAQ
jgi:uncharacterized iron-regulated membrane protein